MPLKTFEVVLDIDLEENDTRDIAAVRQLIWNAIIAIPSDELRGAIISIPAVRKLRSTAER